MLNLWRRHISTCTHRSKGRTHTKCSCPIWVDGEIEGRRIRHSLDTSDWQRAIRKAARLENPDFDSRLTCAHPGCPVKVDDLRCDRHRRDIKAAVAAFHASTADIAESTKHKYKRVLRLLEAFLIAQGAAAVHEVTLEMLNAFRATRTVSPLTWSKELEIVRHFFRRCVDNDWLLVSPAAKVQSPKNLKPADREPYEPNEIAKIIAACDAMGRGPYERMRARAMILLLRYTALRVSDVATLERNRVRNGEILVRTTKNGKAVRLPLHPDLQAALDFLPMPRAGGTDCPYFFWSGNGTKSAMVRDVIRTVSAAYKASGVAGACSHRFRHTLATEILELGGSFEEAADILGDSPAVIRKHYAKWSRLRQERISGLLASIWRTKKGAYILEHTHPPEQSFQPLL